MGLLPGILRIEDTNTYLTAVDQGAVTEAINTILARYQQERNQAQALFVDSQTTEFLETVRLGGYDEGQEIGADTRPLETHVTGQIQVAYPLKRFGWAIGWNEETFATMTVADLDREIDAKLAGNARRHMREIVRALMLKSNYTFVDDLHGNLTIRRLANSDGTLYPPAVNSDSEAEDNHYLVTNYTSDSMSSTNNPFTLLASEVREHFSTTTRIVAFINSAQRANVLSKLPNFVDASPVGIAPAPANAQAIDPNLSVPGDFLGVEGDSGVYVYVYDRIPDGYIVGGAIDEGRPLRRRVSEFASLQGFTVRAEEDHFPFYKRTWIERFGYGVANRLGWACVHVASGGSYTDPTGI